MTAPLLQRASSCGAVALLALACGGRVDIDDYSSSGGSSGTVSAAGAAGKAGAGGTGGMLGDAGAAGASTRPGASELPPCKPGRPPQTSPECPWLGNGLCHDTKLEACACTCPRDRDSSCVSGFPDDEGVSVVYCE
jgi:hypothetical protein